LVAFFDFLQVALNSSNVATESNIKSKLLANLSAANATTTSTVAAAASAAGTAAATTTATANTTTTAAAAAAATTASTTAATNQALNFNNKVKATTATNHLQGNSAIKKHTSK